MPVICQRFLTAPRVRDRPASSSRLATARQSAGHFAEAGDAICPPHTVLSSNTSKLGCNHPMGPLTLADFIGLDVCVAILDVLHQGLGDDKYRACPLLRRMVAAGLLGKKSGRGFYDYSA